MLKTMLVSSITVFAMTSICLAEDLGRYRINDSSLGYEAFLCPSRQFIHLAPEMYYKVFGTWPDSFQQIQDAGIIRRNLTISGDYIITPDDGVFNHNDDILYYPAKGQTPPRIAFRGQIPVDNRYPEVVSTPGIGVGIPLPEMEPDDTWEADAVRTIKNMKAHASIADSSKDIQRFTKRIDNEGVQKLLSIAHMCMYGMTGYKQHFGEYPTSWNEFVDTGFCPVSSEMTNPVTGRPFSTDGSPYSFRFNVTSSGGAYVSVLDEQGEAL